MRPRGPGNEDGSFLKKREEPGNEVALTVAHSRTQSPTYARCDEGLWPNPKPETIKTW